MELVELQRNYPNESRVCENYHMFKDWNGSTGFHLAVNADDWVIGTALELLKESRMIS